LPYPAPKPGLVINYDYLWRDEHQDGALQARKTRPCIIAAVQDTSDGQRVFVWPITHTRQPAIDLPPKVAAHLGLDDQPQFIVANETNSFIWPGPDLQPRSDKKGADVYDYGEIPAKLFDAARTEFFKQLKLGAAGIVKREFDPEEELRKLAESAKDRVR
jgi:hypothetical protein